MDLKSAFDNVNWTKLFNKMNKLHYSNIIVNTIKQLYLSAWTTPSTLDKSIKIEKGVLQGGILSPSLFNIYIDDLA